MRSRIALGLFRAAAFVVQRAPLRLSYAAAGLVGGAAFYLWPRGRRASIRNLAVVRGEGEGAGEERRLARRSFANYARYTVDFLRLPALAPSEIEGLVEGYEEFAKLEEARGTGRGVLIACMHFGNWDLGAAAAVRRGYRFEVVAETLPNAAMDALVVGARERLGMRLLRMEKAGPSLFRTLKRGGLLAVLVDRPLLSGGVCVSFFGRPARVPAGAARLALATGAMVIPVAFARVSPRSPRVRILAGDPFYPVATGDSEADVVRVTERIFRSHERFIREHPDQWYMFRELWPVGQPGR